jgi:hypothetical protein
MIKAKPRGWAALALGAALGLSASGIAVAGPYTASPGDPISITVDENGHGSGNNGVSLVTLPSALQNDPGPGGLSNVLTYSLVNPPGLTAGDLLIFEPGDGLGDVAFDSTPAKRAPIVVWGAWFSIRLARHSIASRTPRPLPKSFIQTLYP